MRFTVFFLSVQTTVTSALLSLCGRHRCGTLFMHSEIFIAVLKYSMSTKGQDQATKAVMEKELSVIVIIEGCS